MSSQPGKHITDIKRFLSCIDKPWGPGIVRIFQTERAFIGKLNAILIHQPQIGKYVFIFCFQQFQLAT